VDFGGTHFLTEKQIIAINNVYKKPDANDRDREPQENSRPEFQQRLTYIFREKSLAEKSKLQNDPPARSDPG